MDDGDPKLEFNSKRMGKKKVTQGKEAISVAFSIPGSLLGGLSK